jgi:pantothenate synthetase
LPDGHSSELVVLAAARLGNARLIDNLRVSLS